MSTIKSNSAVRALRHKDGAVEFNLSAGGRGAKFKVGMALALLAGMSASAAIRHSWTFDSAANTEEWKAFKDLGGLTVQPAVSGTKSVLTAANVKGSDPQVRYNDGGADAALFISSGGNPWNLLRVRLRKLDGNPGQAGVKPLSYNGSFGEGTLAVINQGAANAVSTGEIGQSGGWSISTSADGWVMASYDISSLGTAKIKSIRIDPIAKDTSINFEIDAIYLTTQDAPQASSGPNIIYIIADDMGYSDAGCYGGEIDTPNIDRLAAEGMRFRQFYDCAKCETSRSTLMSGLYYSRSGMSLQKGATIGSALQSGGYRTYAVGKWHLGESTGFRPTERGFNNFYGHYSGASSYFPSGIDENRIYCDTAEPGNFVSACPKSNFTKDSSNYSRQTSFASDFYLTDSFGDNAVEFIDDAVQNHSGHPFFMYLAFNAPHTPLQARVEDIKKYRHSYDAGWDQLRQEKWQRQLASGLVDTELNLPHLRDDIPHWNDLDAATRDLEDHRRSVYAAMVDRMDQNIGKVLDRLDELDATTHPGIVKNTLIIFSSDNGAQAFDNATESQRNDSPNDPDSKWNQGPGWAAFSNTPWRYYKQSQHQGGICTPFVARWPGTIGRGKTTDQPGHFIDVMATFVDITGVDYSVLKDPSGRSVPALDGKSLMPIFTGGTRPAPNFWGFEYGRADFAVIKGNWKLTSFSSGPWRLYNTKTDRTETQNLRWENPEKVTELAALYDQWAIDSYGNTARIYAKRDSVSQMDQELRYAVPQTGQLYAKPSVGIGNVNIGTVSKVKVDDFRELLPIQTASRGVTLTEDNFTFVCKSFKGDGEVIARVESLEGVLSAGHAGVMIRQNLEKDSAFVMSSLQASGRVKQTVRSANGARSTAMTVGSDIAAPVFLRVKRVGNKFTTSYSTDELTWIDIDTTTVAMPAKVYAGLAAASGDAGSAATITFREWENTDEGQYP